MKKGAWLSGMRAWLIFSWLFGAGALVAADKWTANYYQSAPHEYLGKEVRLRIASLSPIPELTASDKGFVWMEAVTGKPPKEEGRILLRIPEADSAKLAKTMNLPSSSGRWLEGTFSGHDSGPILPKLVKERAPYYIQVVSTATPSGAASKPEDLETASGSLVVAPKPKTTAAPTSPAPASSTLAPSAPWPPEGPQAVLFRNQNGEPLQIRTAQSVKMQADFCEIVGTDGKLSLLGKSLVLAILPLPPEGTPPSKEEAAAALRLYAEKAQKLPGADPLLAGAKAAWEKFAGGTSPTVASSALPELEDVETAAGVEEPEAASGYPAWFLWGAAAGLLIFIFLGWIWSRPASYLT